MISRIEALNYRCLQYVRQEIELFQILIGPNGSGKSAFLDVVRFIGQLVSEGLDEAISERTANLNDLIWKHVQNRFEIAVEMKIPGNLRIRLEHPEHNTCRYEVAIGIDPDSSENAILAEKATLLTQEKQNNEDYGLFPRYLMPPNTIITPARLKGAKTIINKVKGGNDNFYDETGKGWDHAFKLGSRKSSLANLPEDESRFPVSTWLKHTLSEGIESLILNSVVMRKPSPPGQPKIFQADGSNLPWVIEDLRKRNISRYEQWLSHVRTSLPDIQKIQTVERPEDRHRYLQILYSNGLKIPSWAVSDGTLRLLALTLIAYLEESGRIWLIEEPENGIHPRAVETIYQSLSSAYDNQILCASHSPVILSPAKPENILCFAQNDIGATDIVNGKLHPNVKDWKRFADLGTLFATGVLG